MNKPARTRFHGLSNLQELPKQREKYQSKKKMKIKVQYPSKSLGSLRLRRVASPTTLTFLHNTMPRRRPVLGQISGNIQKRKELDQFTRGQIVGAAKCGLALRAISRQLSIPYTTIQRTVSQEQLRNNGTSLPRSGRPKKSSKQDERLLLRVVRRFPKYTYQQLLAFTGLKIS
jgi:hypothetical protein